MNDEADDLMQRSGSMLNPRICPVQSQATHDDDHTYVQGEAEPEAAGTPTFIEAVEEVKHQRSILDELLESEDVVEDEDNFRNSEV